MNEIILIEKEAELLRPRYFYSSHKVSPRFNEHSFALWGPIFCRKGVKWDAMRAHRERKSEQARLIRFA